MEFFKDMKNEFKDLKNDLKSVIASKKAPPPPPIPRHSKTQVKGVFCHYMVGGMQPHQAVLDLTQAEAIGIDAFVLNVNSTDEWAQNSVRFLFDAASSTSFKHFFSFDMCHFQHPSAFIDLLRRWIGHPSYYHYEGRPVVSTFWGGKHSFGCSNPNEGWQVHFLDVLAADGIHPFFIPAFTDASCTPSHFFKHFSCADGIMNWESWPWEHEGRNPVSCEVDKTYIKAAQKHGKSFMMGISPLQFKHLSQDQSWYRRGSMTLTERMKQVLELQPQFVQIQTWNDSGESHYVGNNWPDAIPADSACWQYIDGFDHSPWQILLRAFAKAFKEGARSLEDMVPAEGRAAEGCFWYHILVGGARCEADPIGVPRGVHYVEFDEICVAVLLSEQAVGASVLVWSGGECVATYRGRRGLNAWSVRGKRVGMQRVEVRMEGGETLLVSQDGKEVVPDAEKWNLNYEVVALA